MLTIAEATKAMIGASHGNLHDINHFLKVWSFAKTIGELEGLEPKIQFLLELEALTHDIACPFCRKKYGHATGKEQEKESPPLIRAFLQQLDLSQEMAERISYVVSHHHTYTGVDGLDWQILLEADFLVNADESEMSPDAIAKFRDSIFQTSTGRELLDSLYRNRQILDNANA